MASNAFHARRLEAAPWLLILMLGAGCGGSPAERDDTRDAVRGDAVEIVDRAPATAATDEPMNAAEESLPSRGVVVDDENREDPVPHPLRSAEATNPTTQRLPAAASPPAAPTRDIGSVITAAPRDPGSRLRMVDCWFDIPSRAPPVTCYRMQVPESHDRAGSREIDFPVLRLSAAADSEKTPVLHLGGGGPGNPLGLDSDNIGNWVWDWYRELSVDDNRDLYLMDPRGVGMARPVLVCSEYIPAFLGSLSRDLSVGEEVEWNRRVNRQCVDRLRREGVDLSAYNSRSIASDVELLSRALGIPRWNLYGVSYGSRYALTLAREYPELVESMVLDAAVFPNVRYMDHYGRNLEMAFQRLLGHCVSDTTCRNALGDPATRFWDLVRQLNAHPLQTTVSHPDTGRDIALVLNGERFLGVVYNTLYDAAQFRDLPDILSSLERGELGIFEQKVMDWIAFQTDADYGDASAAAHFCYEESPFVDYDGAIAEASQLRNELREASVAMLRYNQEQCRRWPVTPGGAEEGNPVNTPIPTLFLHGALDPVLPVENLENQLRHFGNADVEIFAEVSHSIVGIHPCGETLASAFYNYKLGFREHVSCRH